MSNWESLPIEELVASVSSGGTPRAGDPRYYAESGTPFLKIDDISRSAGRFVDKAEQSITHLALAESAAQIFPAGTVLVTMYGTMGVTKTLRAPMATNQAIAALVPPFRCDPNYLAHALSFRRAGLEALAAQTTQPNISGTIIRRFRIPVPPLEEQRRIAEILDTIDETIQATERVVSKLTCANEGAIGTVIEAAALTGHQSTVEREFEIETGIALNASRVPRSNPVGYLRVANVQRSEIDTSDIAMMEATEDEVRRKALAVGDLLVVEGHASPNEIGRCAVVPRSAEGLLFQNHLFRLRPSSMPSDLARMILNSTEAKAYWRRVCATSSGLHTINSSMLRAMPISVPRFDHQQVLSALVVACDRSVLTAQQELRKLRELRAGLATDLLSGRVRTVAA